MKQPKQRMRIVMDESDAPYECGQYTRTLDDDLLAIQFARKYGLEFIPGSDLDKLSRTMDSDALMVLLLGRKRTEKI